MQSEHAQAAHRDDHGARQSFHSQIAVGLDQDHIAVLVRHRHGCAALPEDVEAHHLQLGKRATHAVRVHDGQAQVRCHRNRIERIQAADLGAHDRGRLAAETLLERAQDTLTFREPEDLLDDDCGRSHAGDRNDQRVVVELIDTQDACGRRLLQRLFEQQSPD
jgi:hypothetical protein